MSKKEGHILIIGLSPGLQNTLVFDNFRVGEVNRSKALIHDASGKCINVCRVLQQAGIPNRCLTILGEGNKQEFLHYCQEDNIDVTSVPVKGRIRTCSTLLFDGESTEIVASESSTISPREEEAFLNALTHELQQKPSLVAMAGSKLDGFSDEVVPRVISMVKEAGIPFFADYRGADLERSFINKLLKPDYVKINSDEFFQTFPHFNNLKEGLMEVSKELDTVFIISRGADSTLIAQQGQLMEMKSQNVKAVNPIGCGDAMLAGILQGIIQKRSLLRACELGRDYASKNAMSIHPGWILED